MILFETMMISRNKIEVKQSGLVTNGIIDNPPITELNEVEKR